MTLVAIGPDEFLNKAPAFLQTLWWARFKASHGWTNLGFRIVTEGRPDRPLSVLLRRLPLGATLAYAPHADVDPSELETLAKALRSQLPRVTLCVRWDLLSGTRVTSGSASGDEESGSVSDPLPQPLPRPLRKPPADVQPPDTVILRLADETSVIDDEVLLANMHKKTRYNIRLAEKKGVTVEKAGVEALGEWYALYQETAARDKIRIHSQQYYRDLFGHAPDLSLWIARFEGKLLAGNIVLVHGPQAVYLYGASSNEHRNLMAPYALQWAALRDCRDRGAVEYDLFGIPPTDDPTHPMHGLYRFKTGFGGDRVHRHGAWDSVFRPFAWLAWTKADAARVWYFKVWKKR